MARPGASCLENFSVAVSFPNQCQWNNGPACQSALARRDVGMQLFSLIMNASLCITACCHARSGPGNGRILECGRRERSELTWITYLPVPDMPLGSL